MRELCIAGLFLLGALPLQGSLVIGQVVNAEKVPIPSAVVRVSSDEAVLISPVLASGRFQININSKRPDLHLTITAPGYEKRYRRLVVQRGVADAKQITMIPIERLRGRSLTVARTSDTKQNLIDVLLENPLSTSTQISAIQIRAVKKEKTDCLDGSRPSLSFKFDDAIAAGRVSVDVTDGSSNLLKSVETRGSLRRFPCEQLHLDLTVGMAFVMRAGEVTTLRFAVPTVVKLQDDRTREDLDLTEFQILTLTLDTDRGVVVVGGR